MGFFSKVLGDFNPIPMIGDVVGGLWSSKEADKNREFQASMSGTSYRRAVADMKAAGLNPLLAVQGGASTPGGSSPSLPSLGNALSSGASAAIAIRNQREELKVKEMQGTIAKDAISLYEKSPNAAKAIQGAMVANTVGLDPKYGALFGLADAPMSKEARKKATKYSKKPNATKGIVDHLMKVITNPHYQELNKKNWRETRKIRNADRLPISIPGGNPSIPKDWPLK